MSEPQNSSEPAPYPDSAQTVSKAITTPATTTLKRPREDDAASETPSVSEAPASKRRVKATNDVVFRIVVPSRQIGKVIGRGGHRIQKIREETKATVKIADAISRNEERVIIVSSKDSDNTFSDAENALHQIVSLILKDDDGNVQEPKVGPEHVAANTIRLLIAGSQAGGLIGVSGQNIENLRTTSGATITVLSPNQLPPCASAHESDRVVQMSGDVPSVLRAVVEIGCQLRDNPPKQVISISPTYGHGIHRQPNHHVDPRLVEHVNLDLMVPENLVGGLIGRFGANISRIRNESGANIKVHGARGEQTQRQIHLSGSAQQVALAKQRVDEYAYAELMRQTGGQQHQTHVQPQPVISHTPLPRPSSTIYGDSGYAHSLYPPRNHQQAGFMAAPVPEIYPPTTAASNQAPYYGYQSYPAPPHL